MITFIQHHSVTFYRVGGWFLNRKWNGPFNPVWPRIFRSFDHSLFYSKFSQIFNILGRVSGVESIELADVLINLINDMIVQTSVLPNKWHMSPYFSRSCCFQIKSNLGDLNKCLLILYLVHSTEVEMGENGQVPSDTKNSIRVVY